MYFRKLTFFIGSTCLGLLLHAQPIKQIMAFCDSTIRKGFEQGQFPGLTMSIVTPHQTMYLSAGIRDFSSRSAIDSMTTFELGSIGKVLTAMAVLQLVDEGKLELHTDINHYLPFKVENPYSQNPVTLVDLLTHTAGLNDKNVGYLARELGSVQPLCDHLKNELPSFYKAAGEEISYSNYAYALSGLIVEQVSQEPFAAYVAKNIFQRLGMTASSIGPPGYQLNFARGHLTQNEEFIQVESYPRHAVPAGSLHSTARDINYLLKAVLAQDHGLLSARSWQLLLSPQFENHQLLNGYSLGLEEQRINGKPAWAKSGMVPGFLSQLLILPDSLAIFLSANSSLDNFQELFFEAFFARFYPESITSQEAQKIDITPYLGEYRSVRYNRDGVESLITLFSGSVEILESASGNLLLWHNGSMNEYEPIDKHVFQHTSNPKLLLVFEGENERINYLMRNVNIGGLTVPGKFEKLSWYNSPNYLNEYYGFVLIGICAFILVLLGHGLIRLVRVWKPDFYRFSFLPWQHYLVGFLVITTTAVHLLWVMMPLFRNTEELLFGWPGSFPFFNSSAYLLAAFTCLAMVLFAKSLYKSPGSILSKGLFGLMSVSAAFHSWTLWYWNFI